MALDKKEKEAQDKKKAQEQAAKEKADKEKREAEEKCKSAPEEDSLFSHLPKKEKEEIGKPARAKKAVKWEEAPEEDDPMPWDLDDANAFDIQRTRTSTIAVTSQKTLIPDEIKLEIPANETAD